MKKQCPKCHGEGWAKGKLSLNDEVIGLLPPEKSMRLQCPVCRGEGSNPSYRETRCQECLQAVGYHKDQTPPLYCETCLKNHELVLGNHRSVPAF